MSFIYMIIMGLIVGVIAVLSSQVRTQWIGFLLLYWVSLVR